VGVLRREFLQVGFSGLLGLSLPGFLALRSGVAAVRPAVSRREPDALAPSPRAQSLILVFLTGGLSHIDSFDMKPEAPEGIRGEFRPIDTAVPGIPYCEHLPRLAARADKLAVVRSLAHSYTNHLNATHEVLTGHAQPGPSSTRSPRAMTIRVTPRRSTRSGRDATGSPAACSCRRS
jgi:hypothetical protein